jgi:hypothetical protein
MAVRPTALYPPGIFLELISVRGWADFRHISQLEGLGPLQNAITSSGIKIATFLLAA